MKSATLLDRNLTLLDLIERRTREGELMWSETEQDETFQADSASYSMRIKPEALPPDLTSIIRAASLTTVATNPYSERSYILEIFNSEGNKTNEIGVARMYYERGSSSQSSLNSIVATGLKALDYQGLISLHEKLVDIYDVAQNQILAKETDIDKLIGELQ